MTDQPNRKRRSKRKPPKGVFCDTKTADQSGKHPVLRRCKNEATVELLGYAPVGETWVCEKCAAFLEKRGRTFDG